MPEPAANTFPDSDAIYREVFDSTSDGIFIHDAHSGAVLAVNRTATEMFRCPRDQMIGQSALSFCDGEPPYSAKDAADWLHRAVHEGPQTFEWRAKRGDDQRFWVEVALRRCEIAGKPFVLATVRDINERRRMEEIWRASEQRFRLLMEHAQDGIAMCERVEYTTHDGTRRLSRKLVFCNDRFVEMAGRTRDELLHCPDLTQLTRATVNPGEQTQQRQRRDAGLPYGGVSSWIRPDGKENFFEWVSVPLRISGKLYTLEMDRDITQRRHAEQELLLKSSALEATANGTFITDRAGRIIWVNPAFSRMTGYEPADLIGRNPRMLKSGQHSRQFYEQLWDTVLHGRVWQGELVNKRKDGSCYIEEQTITPVYGASGQITHFIAVQRDVTERRRLEEQLRQTNKLEAVGRLAGGIAHDFNNILSTIISYNELMLRQLPQYDPLRREAVEVEKAAYRAAQLTRQLLALSREQVLQPAVLNLNQIVTDMSHMLHRVLGDDILLRTTLTDPLGPTKADSSQIEQVILNLAVNARDAMPNGGVLTIATSHATVDEDYATTHLDTKPGEYVLLSVTDTGAGFSPEARAHLFEPFFTTKDKEHASGLGLATSYGIVKQSGGHIIVYSEPGRGTCVKVYLPRLPGETPVTKSKSLPGSLPRGAENLLVVEDEPTLRSLATTMLREQGYTVLSASNGVEALALLAEHPDVKPHLVVTDVVMPQMGGRDLVAKLRQANPMLKVLFTSGYTREVLPQEVVEEKDVFFLQKPYSQTTLARKIREVLDQAA